MQGPGAFTNVIASTVTIYGPNGGIFVYSSNPPASGTLISSDAGSAGANDGFGNAFLQGFTTYTQIAGQFIATNYTNNTVTQYTAPAASGPYTLANASLQLSSTATLDQIVMQANDSVSQSYVQVTSGTAAPGQVNLSTTNTASTDDTQLLMTPTQAALIAHTPAGNASINLSKSGGTVIAGGLSVTGGTTTDSETVTGNLTVNGEIKAAPLSIVTSTVVSNSTAEGNIGVFTIPANDMQANSRYKLVVWGTCSTLTGTPGVLTIRVRIDGLAGQFLMAAPGITLNSAMSSKPWALECTIESDSSGTATVHGCGTFMLNQLQSTAGMAFVDANSPTGINTASSVSINVTAQFTVANAANTVTTVAGTLTKEAN